jgi:hypothetical protein
MDTKALEVAYDALLEAAKIVPADARPSDGGWNADQILAHVTLVNAITIAAIADVTAGVNTTYDNRASQDSWTIDRVIARAGGSAGLQDRIRQQGKALCALSGSALGEEELDTLVPSLLLSNSTLLVDQPLPLRDLITGFAESELPGHTQQLLALVQTS